MSQTQSSPEQNPVAEQPKDYFAERREQTETEPKKESSETIETYLGMDGNRRTHLKNGAEARVVAVNIPAIINSTESRLKDADMAVAGEAGKEIGEEEAVQEIDEQLQEGRVEGNRVSTVARVFRQFGRDIYSVPKGGIDMRQLGNQIDLTGKAVFVIPEVRSQEMQSKLHNLSTSTGEMNGSFHVETHNVIDPKNGFEVYYTYTSKKGTEIKEKLVFLYARDGQKEEEPTAEAEKAENDEAETPENTEKLAA